MEKIVQFCKERYKVLIPVMVVFVLLITVYFLYKEYKYDNYRNKQDVLVYQYFGGVKNEYTARIVRNLKDVIVDVSPVDKKIEYDATPIYYSEEDKIIFPKVMSIVFPLKDGSQYRLYKYALYENEEDNHMITNGNIKNDYSYFFLFDGKGLYFFPDEVVLNINDKEYKTLSAGSYVQVIGGYTTTYYDKESDTSEVIETEGKKITVTSEKINVNLSERKFSVFSNNILLAEPDILNSITD